MLKPGYLNLSLAARDWMLSSPRCLTRLWGAHAFLLGCYGVPGAVLKPMGCSLQPAPTARHRADNRHGRYKYDHGIVFPGTGEADQCLKGKSLGRCVLDIPSSCNEISSPCQSQIADLPMPAGLPCNSLLCLAGTVPPGPLKGQNSMVGYEEEKLRLSPSVLAQWEKLVLP